MSFTCHSLKSRKLFLGRIPYSYHAGRGSALVLSNHAVAMVPSMDSSDRDQPVAYCHQPTHGYAHIGSTIVG